MNWFNENKTRMINLDSINGFVYIRAKDYVSKNPLESDIQDFREKGDKIELIIGGSVFVFRGDEAQELYRLILANNDKEITYG
jgi:hypothetical protein